jgi:hypothetical protein
MIDLIDRSEVLYKFAEILPEADSLEWYEQAKPEEFKDLVDELYSIVLSVNRIDAQPVKSGKWKRNASGELGCSNCGYVPKWDDDKFCAGCGAKMESENDGR